MVLGLVLNVAHVQRKNGHATGGRVMQFHVAVAPHPGQLDAGQRRRKLAVGFGAEERQDGQRTCLLGSAKAVSTQVQLQGD